MKQAKQLDYKKKLLNKDPVSGVTSICRDGGGALNFRLVSSICGLNGSGKTRLLKAIDDPNKSDFEGFRITRLNSKTYYLNPSLLVSESLAGCRTYKESSELSEILDQNYPFSFESDLLTDLNYVLNSRFSSVCVYQLESLVGKEIAGAPEIFGYCTAKKNDIELDSETLSHGELYVILLLWVLKTSEAYNTFLIDEAETFLSPVAQTRLSDVLIKFSVASRDNNCQIIVSTHSPFILDSIGYDSSFTIERMTTDLRIERATKKILTKIGLTTSRHNVVFLEDSKSKMFLELVFENFLPAWQHNNVLISLGGEGDLRTVYKLIKNPGRNKVVLIFDADIPNAGGLDDSDAVVSMALPGVCAPELELINCISNYPSEFLNLFGAAVRDDIDSALASVQGIDHHDYFVELSRLSSVPEKEIFRNAFHLWVGENKAICMNFVRNFTSKTT